MTLAPERTVVASPGELMSARARLRLVLVLGFLIALGGFGYSIFLTYIEIFKIEAICQWCVASAVLMTILFLLNATRLIGYGGSDGSVPDHA